MQSLVSVLVCLACLTHARRTQPCSLEQKLQNKESRALELLSLALKPARVHDLRPSRISKMWSRQPVRVEKERVEHSLARRDLVAAVLGGIGVSFVQPVIAAEEPKKKKDIADLRDENYNADLLKQIEDMRDKRDDMSLKILKYEEEAAKLRKDIASRNGRLSKLEALIAQRQKLRVDLDEDITDAETELFKILETSSGLLNKLKSKIAR